MKIQIRKLGPFARTPKYMTDGSACMDLYAAGSYEVWPFLTIRVHTGIAMAIPPGFEGQIRPRSGLATAHGLTIINSPATIDSDYRGEITVTLTIIGNNAKFSIEDGDRIAQMAIVPVIKAELVLVNELGKAPQSPNKRIGGLGSTGIK